MKIDGNLEKRLPFNAKQVVIFQEMKIVLVDDNSFHRCGDKSINRNVYAFDSNGTLLWQIHEAPDGGDENPKPYTRISVLGKSILVDNWIGTEYQVEINTGTVSRHGVNSRPW